MTRFLGPALCSSLVLAPLLCGTARAQDNAKAGLFTEARQLPLVSQAIAVQIDGDEATLHLSQVFVNDGPALGQADYQLHLPKEATVEGFGFWQQDRFLGARLQARADAHAAHARAAEQGRATALMDREGSIWSFSVFPVEAGSLKQIETTMRLPIEVEGGRRELRLPVDRFLGQEGATSTITVRLRTEHRLDDVGLALYDGSELDVRRLDGADNDALLATSTNQPLVLHWQEEAPPLDLWAQRVDTPDGTAVAVRVGLGTEALAALNPAASTWKRVVLIVDASASMRRRRRQVEAVIQRVTEHVTVPVTVRAAADGQDLNHLPSTWGQRTTWPELADLVASEGCGDDIRCLVLTDAQLPDIHQAATAPAQLLVLADAHEAAFFADQIPTRAAVYQPDIDPAARLAALTDQAVLPVLEIDRLTVGGRSLSPLGSGPWRVAEGGSLRLQAMTDLGPQEAGLPLVIEGRLGGQALRRELALPDATDLPSGRRTQRSVYRSLLAAWMRGWRDQPDDSLQARITEISLREQIPTAFTSLQVDDPELSLVAIKPGDPTLTVDGAPGVTDVIAWYPFGEQRRLKRQAATFSDRFLVPRWWPERAYRVETFSRKASGRVEQKGTWYVLDEALPEARVSADAGRLVVDTGEQTPDIGAVEVHGPGRVWRLSLDQGSPLASPGHWTLPLSQLPDRFTVVVRDRAGNVGRWSMRQTSGELAMEDAADTGPVVDARATEAPDAPSRDVLPDLVHAATDTMSLDGSQVVVHLADRSLHFDARHLSLRSLRLTAAAEVDEGVLLGTAGGDLLRLQCKGRDCTAQALPTGHRDHPITGISRLADGRPLIGILGVGLVQLSADLTRLSDSPLRVGSRFVTGVARAPDGDVLIGTAYNGLWRLADGRGQALRTRFPHDHVSGLRVPGELLSAADGEDPQLEVEINSGFGTFLRLSRDRFVFDSAGLNDLGSGAPNSGAPNSGAPNSGDWGSGAPDLVDLLSLGDSTLVAGFDSGLWQVGPEGELTNLSVPLSVDEARVNAMAVFHEELYLATEGGLLALDPDHPEDSVRRLLSGAVHDLDAGPLGLAIASSAGLYVIDGSTNHRDPVSLQRVDLDSPLSRPRVGTGRYLSVAWHGPDLYAGTLDGLVHLQHIDTVHLTFELSALTVADGLQASWVTALCSDGQTLWVGTYSDGLWTVDGEDIQPVEALAHQWLPPHSLTRIGDSLWVGGLGMPPARLDRDGTVSVLRLPVRDSNAIAPQPGGGLLVATSDGLVRIDAPTLAGR